VAGYEDDAQRSPRTWLRWQTRVTGAAASASVGWMRRLRSHPAVANALADGRISASWAREICEWTDQLPEDARDDADRILLGAAAGSAELSDLARLAEEMRRRLAEPEGDGDDGFEDRQLRLQTTLGGAGRLDGDLTPRCAESVQAVLDALGKKAGPEDTRTKRQRYHDALEDACRRLIATGCLPDRAGQPTKIQLHLTLDELARQNQAHPPTDGTRPQASSDQAGPFWPTARPGDTCDATIVPIVTGRVDQDLLDQLAAKLAGTDRDDRDRESISSLILANAVALLSGPGRPARCCACLTPGPWEPRSENRVPDLIRLTHPAILHHAESPGKCRWSTRCSTRTAPPTCGAGTGVPQPQPAHRSCLN
jgi:hypothetical protein